MKTFENTRLPEQPEPLLSLFSPPSPSIHTAHGLWYGLLYGLFHRLLRTRILCQMCGLRFSLFVWLGVLVCGWPLLVGCQNRKADAKQQENKPSWKDLWSKRQNRAKPVHAATLHTGTITSLLSSTTTLTAEEDVSIMTQVNGLVEVVYGLEGRRFRRKGLLARLSNPYLTIAYDRAKLEVGKLKYDFVRQQKLLRKGYVSRETVENLRFQLEQAENQLQKAQEDINNLRVYSTIGGVVTQRLIQKGAWVIPQQKAFQMENPRSLVAHVAAPERYLPRLKLGQVTYLQAEALGNQHIITGKVIRIAPSIDPKTGTVQVTVGDLKPLDSLRSGMFVTVQIVLERRVDVPLIPKVAVSYYRNKAYVFRLKERDQPCKPPKISAVCEADRIYIEKGLENTDWIEVRSGIKTGEHIIVMGQEGLRPKRQVRVVQWRAMKPPKPSSTPQKKAS